MTHLFRKAEGIAGSAEAAVQTYRESRMEEKTRELKGFHEAELALPDIKKLPATDDRPSFCTDILSHLGTWNPLPHEITSNDTVWYVPFPSSFHGTQGAELLRYVLRASWLLRS